MSALGRQRRVRKAPPWRQEQSAGTGQKRSSCNVHVPRLVVTIYSKQKLNSESETMECETDWSAMAGNGRCVPMPKTMTEISDRFTGIWLGAPEFASLKKSVTYPLTLEMMFGVLRAAVSRTATHCKTEEARAAYLASLNELDMALKDYRAGEVTTGSLRTQLAQHLFRWGALPRSRTRAAWYVETLRQDLEQRAERRP